MDAVTNRRKVGPLVGDKTTRRCREDPYGGRPWSETPDISGGCGMYVPWTPVVGGSKDWKCYRVELSETPYYSADNVYAAAIRWT